MPASAVTNRLFVYTPCVQKANLPPIESESISSGMRIIVPKTAPVERYYRRARTTRLVAMVALSVGCLTIGLAKLHDMGWDAMWFLFSVTFGAPAIYAIRNPYLFEMFVPDTTVLVFDDSNLVVTEVECKRTRCFPTGDILSFNAVRCDFSCCSKLVIRGRTTNRRRYRAIIAVYAELRPLSGIAETLSQTLLRR